MNHLQNLHTHTTYCDGIDTPEEMIQHAISKGFDSVGFSGHSYMFYSPTHSMSPEGTEAYKREVMALKKKYAGKIGVYLGLELDMYSKIDLSGYDYIIGSVHYFKINGEHVGFDRSPEMVQRVIDEHFGGSGLAFAKEYYRSIVELPDYGDIDIIGHFDLVTKNRNKMYLFDEDSKEYKNAALEAIDALSGRIPLFEVNTGAIARGNRRTPYPTLELVKEFKRRGFGAVISSDCHDGRLLDCAFDDAAELLRAGGFKERYVLTDDGFIAVPL